MTEKEVIQISSLPQAREELSKRQEGVILINALGSVRALGAMAVDRMFKVLKDQYRNIDDTIFRVDDDLPAVFYAVRKKYAYVQYTGSSEVVSKLMQENGITNVKDVASIDLYTSNLLKEDAGEGYE